MHLRKLACLWLLGACEASATPEMADAGAAHDAAHVDARAPEPAPVLAFRKITLHRDFVCEGAAIGDLDRDGQADVIAGPSWYAGPDFDAAQPVWPSATFEVDKYSNCFFQWARDVDGDGWLDVIVVGFPGQDASWLRNPGEAGGDWARHVIASMVDTESPELLDVVGDDAPELLLATGGKLSYAQPGADSRAPWLVHPLTEDRGFVPFTHGLGAADIDGDGRTDVLEATGWWQQPASLEGDPVWRYNAQPFGAGGGQMFGDDVDGDGDADVITTYSAHGYGLSWFEQAGGSFVEHVIVPSSTPAPDAPVIAHEPHALALADLDGDGRRDLIFGERHWGHVPEGMPDFDAPARLYWLWSAGDGRYVPQLVDDDSGVGTQIAIGDVNADDRPDIVIANKKGAFVFVQE